MKLAILGANGSIGQVIVAEARRRGHHVTALVRDPSKVPSDDPDVSVVQADVTGPGTIARAIRGHDALISAIGPARASEVQLVVDAATALIEALTRAEVRRLIVLGGAGSLEVAPGWRLVDTPDFPIVWKPIALAHADALKVYREDAAALDWTYVSPAAYVEPGTRTGTYRVGFDALLTDAEGKSSISIEDLAVALIDEAEQGKYLRQRITVAY